MRGLPWDIVFLLMRKIYHNPVRDAPVGAYSGTLTRYLLFAKLISEFGYFVAILAYTWGAICMLFCGWLTQRWLNKNWRSDNSRSLSEVRLKLVGDGIESSDRPSPGAPFRAVVCGSSNHDRHGVA